MDNEYGKTAEPVFRNSTAEEPVGCPPFSRNQ